MDILNLLLQGLAVSLIPINLIACTIGVLIGTLVGVLPGIDTVSAIALLLPFSYSMDSTAALIMFAGIYYGSKYGGSTTSILINVREKLRQWLLASMVTLWGKKAELAQR